MSASLSVFVVGLRRVHLLKRFKGRLPPTERWRRVARVTEDYLLLSSEFRIERVDW